jgi:hypothetical protein
VAGNGVQVGLPVEGRAFVAHLNDYLARIAAEADAGFPANEYLRIEAGEPILGRLPRLEEPQDVKELEQRIAERIEPRAGRGSHRFGQRPPTRESAGRRRSRGAPNPAAIKPSGS